MVRNKKIAVKEGLARLAPLTEEQKVLFVGIKNEYWRYLRKYSDEELELAFRKWWHDMLNWAPAEYFFEARAGFAEDIDDIANGSWDERMPDELRGF